MTSCAVIKKGIFREGGACPEQHRGDLAAALGEVEQVILDCLRPAEGGASFQDDAKRAIEMPQGLTVATDMAPRSGKLTDYGL